MGICVSIIEADRSTRKAWSALLDGTPGFRCASSHTHLEHALNAAPAAKPDILLLNVMPPGTNEMDAIRRLRQKLPKLQVVVLSRHDGAEHLFKILKSGVSAYLLHPLPPAEMLEALRIVHHGGGCVSPAVARNLLRHFEVLVQHDRQHNHKLTPREVEVLGLARRGLSYKQISHELKISFDTVRSHFRNINKHLEVHSRAEAVAKYFNF